LKPTGSVSCLLALAACHLLLVACTSPSSPTVIVDPITIDSVSVQLSGDPARPVARVRGVVGDGCSSLHSVSQTRAGSAVTVTILRERPKDAICTQLAKLYDERIPLDGSFPPGRYTLRVNAFETAFETS